MVKNNNSLSKMNDLWFSRKGAFIFLKEDIESQIRIKKVINIFKNIYNDSSGHKLLDIGCGAGEISEKLINIGYEVYGLDISRKALQAAKKKGVKTKRWNLSKGLPYKNQAFEYVFAGETIEHLIDIEFILSEISRVVKKEGFLMITTPNLVHLPDRLSFLLGNNPAQFLPTHEFLKLHVRQFSHSSLHHLLQINGFRVLKSQSTTVVLRRSTKNPNKVLAHSRLLADIFPSLGASIIITARKV